MGRGSTCKQGLTNSLRVLKRVEKRIREVSGGCHKSPGRKARDLMMSSGGTGGRQHGTSTRWRSSFGASPSPPGSTVCHSTTIHRAQNIKLRYKMVRHFKSLASAEAFLKLEKDGTNYVRTH